MLKRIAIAALAAGALALNAPAALADQPTYDCAMPTVQQDELTGQSHQGVMVVMIAHEGPVSITCRVVVQGVTQVSVSASGQGLAVGARDFSYIAETYELIQLCADYTSVHHSGTTCVTLGTIQIPPQIMYDTVDSVLEQVGPILDPPLCEALKLLAPGIGPISINSQGDVYVDGQRRYDCPPYDIVWE